MSRARRARRIAAAAAFGGGGLGVLGAAGFGLLVAEAKLARRMIGQPFGETGPEIGEIYGAGPGEPLVLAMLGDSSAVGLGVEQPEQTPGVVIASGLAAISGRRVRLHRMAMVGAESSALAEQVELLLAEAETLDVAVIMIGANDVTHRVKPATAVRALAEAVRKLRAAGAEVVVGTCPDLGTIEPIPPPLRHVARHMSRQLAAAQTIAVVEAGGRTVSLGNMLGPEFAARPRVMFSSDGFHPSAAGYARAAATLLHSVAAALGFWSDATAGRRDEVPRQVDDVAHAAVRAAQVAGTEVAGTEVAGAQRGPRGRWAVLRLRRGAVAVATTGVGAARSVFLVLGGAKALIPVGRAQTPDAVPRQDGERADANVPEAELAPALGMPVTVGADPTDGSGPGGGPGPAADPQPTAEEEPCPKP
jgi:lysophospholipase L1-like esterase